MITEYLKIVLAGAGAYHFAPAILEDLFMGQKTPVEVWMVDSDLDMAELTARAAQSLARAFGTPARFYYTTQLPKAVFSADAVFLCADYLDEEGWKSDFETMDGVGLGKQVRLYGGLGGLMQTLRAGGFVGNLAEQMARECPGAPLLICDNGFGGMQLGRLCDGIARVYGIRTLGLSAVTEQTRTRLSLYLNVPEQDLLVTCAGLNAFSWVTQLRNGKTGEDLTERCMKEMREDPREELSAQYIDFYGAIPAGSRVMQYELLPDTPLSPRRTVLYSGVGYADYELRKRNLALLTVHGPLTPKGMEAWGQIRTSGYSSVRPASVFFALSQGKCRVDSLCMPGDGALEGTVPGRYVEGPAEIEAGKITGVACQLPLELEDLLNQISLSNRLYGEAALTGSRDLIREAMEIDPALSGLDLLYCEEIVDEMMEKQKARLPRFFGEDGGTHVSG